VYPTGPSGWRSGWPGPAESMMACSIIAELLGRPGPPDQAAIIELRARYDIEQLTPMIPDRRRGLR
jgi:hypothetical protein